MTGNGGTPPASQPAPGARAALTLLLLINLFNYIDRQVLAAVEPNIRFDFFQDPARAVGAVGMTISPTGYGPLLSASLLYKDRTVADGAMFWMGMLSTAFLVFF